MFQGYSCHVIPFHNVDALFHNKYFVVGKIIATAAIQGGQAPAYFSDAIADYIYDSVKSPVDLEDIPDINIQALLKKVHNCIS